MDYKLYCSIAFSIAALVFTLIVLGIYLSKYKKNDLKSILFVTLLIFNILGSTSEFFHAYTLHIVASETIMKLFCQLHAIFLILRYYTIMAYVVALIYEYKIDKIKKRNVIEILILIIAIINSGLTLVFDVDLVFNTYVYDYESTAYTLLVAVPYILCIIFIIALFVSKSVKRNEIVPLFYTVAVIFIGSALQIFTPIDANYQNYMIMLLTVGFYFTTANQDVNLIQKLDSQKAITEMNNEQRSELLSTISNDIKNNINNINLFSEMILRTNNITDDDLKKDINNIYESTILLENKINTILDDSNEVNKENGNKKENIVC